MQILKVKTQADFDAAVVKEGALLIFPEQQGDGSYVLKYKDSDGNIREISSGEPGGVSGGQLVYVCPETGEDDNPGSLTAPLRTIQQAVDSGAFIIRLLPGVHRCNILLHDYGEYGLLIQGYACMDNAAVFIKPEVDNNSPVFTFSGTTGRVRIKDVQVDGDGRCKCAYDNGSGGRHHLDNVVLENSGGQPVIHRENGQNWFEVSSGVIDGQVLLDGTAVDATFGVRYGTNSYNCRITVNDGYMAKVNYVERLGPVTHNGGTLAAMYVSSWMPDENGHIVNSTANLPEVCLVGWSNLSVDGMNFGDINAAGTAVVIQKYNIDGS